MSHAILDKAYTLDNAAGVSAFRVVVAGDAAGQCKPPSSQNADKILGVTTHAQDDGRNVAVRKIGVASVEAAGAIGVGDAVNVAGASGKVQSLDDETAQVAYVLGFAETAAHVDGDRIDVWIAPHVRDAS